MQHAGGRNGRLRLQGCVGLLSGGEKVAGREVLADLIKVLEQGITEMLMMLEGVGRTGTTQVFQILLQDGEIFLRGGKVTRPEVAGELVEGLGDGVRGGGRRGRGNTDASTRKGFLQGGEIGLRGREIAGQEILAELFDALLVRSAGCAELLLEEAAA